MEMHDTYRFLKGVAVYVELPVGLFRTNVSPRQAAVSTWWKPETLGLYVIETGVIEATKMLRTPAFIGHLCPRKYKPDGTSAVSQTRTFVPTPLTPME